MKSFLVFFAAVSVSVAIFAQETNSPDDTQVLRDEIVVTASALPEEISSVPGTVDVIVREEIEARNDRARQGRAQERRHAVAL